MCVCDVSERQFPYAYVSFKVFLYYVSVLRTLNHVVSNLNSLYSRIQMWWLCEFQTNNTGAKLMEIIQCSYPRPFAGFWWRCEPSCHPWLLILSTHSLHTRKVPFPLCPAPTCRGILYLTVLSVKIAVYRAVTPWSWTMAEALRRNLLPPIMPWMWRQHNALRRWYPRVKLYGVTSKHTVRFMELAPISSLPIFFIILTLCCLTEATDDDVSMVLERWVACVCQWCKKGE